jgi:hypothetical protein
MGKHRSSVRRVYATRRKYSPCRGLMTAKCRNRSGCKMALGKKRSFCRRTRSARHRSKARRSKARRSKARTRRSRSQSGGRWFSGSFQKEKKLRAAADAAAAAAAAADAATDAAGAGAIRLRQDAVAAAARFGNGEDDGNVFDEKMVKIRRQMPAEAKDALPSCDEVALNRALSNLRPRYNIHTDEVMPKTRYLEGKLLAEANPENVALLSLSCGS